MPGGGGGERSSWYHKLRSSSKRDGGGAHHGKDSGAAVVDLAVSRSVLARKNGASAGAARAGAGAGELKSMALLKEEQRKGDSCSGSSTTAVAGSLIESHLSSRKELPWDQDFSSMSSCRSDLDSQGRPLKRSGDDADDLLLLPPLLRNPHIAQFDIVEACSTSSSSPSSNNDSGSDREEEDEEIEDREEEEEEEAGAGGGGVEERACKDLLWPRKRRSHHNDNSFSASLPSEIKGAVADSIPLVKYSHNPYQDFRDSMLEMIREKGLERWSDLEELLFCYLSLNSPEHHEVIKQSFSDIWQDLGSSSSPPPPQLEED